MEPKKKILIFSLAYFPLVGGAEVAVKEITDRLSKEGFEFDMVTLRFSRKDPATDIYGAVRIYRVGSGIPFMMPFCKLMFPFTASFKALRLNLKNKYDSMWSIMANYAGFAALFFKVCSPQTPFILTLQEGDPIDYILRRVRYVRPIFNRIFTRADTLQAISHYLSKFGQEMGFTGRNVVVPNGVDYARFSVNLSLKEKASADEKIGRSAGDYILFTSSRLVIKNAVDDCITALQYLPEHARLVIAGEGPLRTTLEGQIQTLGFGSRVSFLGYVSHADLPALLAVSDVFVRPSRSEGFGNSFIEAMAAGVPVVTTAVGGIPDFLVHDRTGLFCGVNDPKDLAKKVEIFMRDTELRNEIIDNARRMVREKYDWNTVAASMKGVVFLPTIADKTNKR
jgi:glycosyltransferase involved in cell wall biosynthesis